MESLSWPRSTRARWLSPGDKIEEYFKLLAEAEKLREPLRRRMKELNEEFYDHLLVKYSERTARKHSTVVDLFIEFICKQTDVESIEEITQGMANTHFRQWWKRKVWDSTTPDQLRVALKKFFTFLAAPKGIVNDKALKGLQ
jgi:site-specific recombinase XerD